MLSARQIDLSINEQRWIERHPVVRFVVNDDLAPLLSLMPRGVLVE